MTLLLFCVGVEAEGAEGGDKSGGGGAEGFAGGCCGTRGGGGGLALIWMVCTGGLGCFTLALTARPGTGIGTSS